LWESIKDEVYKTNNNTPKKNLKITFVAKFQQFSGKNSRQLTPAPLLEP
jgi:hypothetical protein